MTSCREHGCAILLHTKNPLHSILVILPVSSRQTRLARIDTSIYITALRLRNEAALGMRRSAAGAPVWLSSVVLEELYAGVSTHTQHVVERLERDFQRAGRILVPNLTDWTQTGKVLALLAAKYDYEQIGKGRLTNDALIAMSAGRSGIIVITVNARHFKKLAESWPFRWRIEKPQSS